MAVIVSTTSERDTPSAIRQILPARGAGRHADQEVASGRTPSHALNGELGAAAAYRHLDAGDLARLRVMTYEVRAARENDIRDIEAVYFRSWRAAYDGSFEDDVLDELAEQRRRTFDWSRGVNDSAATVLVGVDTVGAVLGVVQANEMRTSPRDSPEITMLYVDPAAWGLGVASDLLSSGLQWIADGGQACAAPRSGTPPPSSALL